MVHHVDFFRADIGRKIKYTINAERCSFNPITIFPVAAIGCYFADIDFRIEIGSKGQTVVASVAVDNIQIMNFIEIMFFQIRGINVGYTWIKTGTE